MPVERFSPGRIASGEKGEGEALVNVNSFAKRGAISRTREEERGPPSFHVFCTLIIIDGPHRRKLRGSSGNL
jgi:hypothetical protein